MAGKEKPQLFIIGAGFAGRAIAAEIKEKEVFGGVAAFLDDDPEKLGRTIDGIPVLGPVDSVAQLLQKKPSDEALIAIPGASTEQLKRIYSVLETANFSKIRILPRISQILEGDAHLIQTREIDPEDILGRNPIKINLKESLHYIRGKRVLVTGAGGSVGSELSRQLLSGGAERLYLFGHGENSIYEIDKELRLLQEEGVGEQATVVPVIGSLADRDYMDFILKRLKADIVFHAAAYKHVPMSEANPIETIKNNVFGTENLVKAAEKWKVKRFVHISTDKVVDPVSIYAASKLIAEEIVLSRSSKDNDFIAVRFGNVLGSRGSFLTLFRQQIKKGGPLTLTDPRCSRYIMTIPEAASLVLKAGGVGEGGILYHLDMGEPVLIKDVACQMIRFYGFEPEQEIKIKTIGIRRGEKITEEIIGKDEESLATEFPRINKVRKSSSARIDIQALLSELQPVCFNHADSGLYRNRIALRRILRRHIPSVTLDENEPEY